MYKTGEITVMSNEANKTVVQTVFQMLISGDTAAVEKYFAPNWVNHDPSLPPLQGLEGAKQLINLWSALTDREMVVEDAVAEGDKVAMRFNFSGKQTGELMGISPTGKTIHLSGTGIFRIVDGKLTDNWVNIDALGMLQQLGAVPTPNH
jgi:predicted ester cyclase